MTIETSVLVPIVIAIVTVIFSLISAWLRREVKTLEKKLDYFSDRLNSMEELIKAHEQQIAVNSERDRSDYRLVQNELNKIKSDLEKEVKTMSTMLSMQGGQLTTRLKSLEATLDRILNRLDNKSEK